MLGFSPSGNQVSFSKAADAFAFGEDSSSDGLSPDHNRSEEPQSSAGSPPDAKATEAPLAGPVGTIQVKIKNNSILVLSFFIILKSTLYSWCCLQIPELSFKDESFISET
jgi:hypothetical protein